MEEFVEVKTVRLQRVGVSKSIELTVCTNSHDMPDICYIIDRELPISMLLRDYCKLRNIGYKYNDVILMYDGIRILPYKCADELEMENGDIIDAFFDQMSGLRESVDDFEDIRRIRCIHLRGFNSNEIKLRVQRQGKSDICYMLDRKCPLRKLFEDYCNCRMVNFVDGTMRFLYDGTRLPADKCADDLKMEDGDIIDVFFDQIGG